MVTAALLGVADVLDARRRERAPQVEEEAPGPVEDPWLVLLDREDPSRSLVIVPQRLSFGPTAPVPDPGPSGGGHNELPDDGRPRPAPNGQSARERNHTMDLHPR